MCAVPAMYLSALLCVCVCVCASHAPVCSAVCVCVCASHVPVCSAVCVCVSMHCHLSASDSLVFTRIVNIVVKNSFS